MFVVKQKGPTCGIYALLNGVYNLFDIKGCKSTKTHKIVLKLLKMNQIDQNHLADGRTFVGEFFDINEYLQFIINNKNFIISEIMNCFKNKIMFEVEKVPFSSIKNEIDALFLVPILDNKKDVKNNQVISHWIAVQFNEKTNKYNVMNSRIRSRIIKSSPLHTIREKHFDLKDAVFYWNRYNRKKRAFSAIENHVQTQLKNKYEYIENGILKNKVHYTTGEVIMIKALV